MGSVVKGLDKVMATMDLEKVSEHSPQLVPYNTNSKHFVMYYTDLFYDDKV